MDLLKLKKSWEVALAPAKALPMNAIMMYMSGNSLQIFSIMMVFMLFKNPMQALLQTNQVFARFETPSTRSKMWMTKLVYVLMNLLALSLGVWKVNGMGLLPYVAFLSALLGNGLTRAQDDDVGLACMGDGAGAARAHGVCVQVARG
jgi:hypothetical protein